MKKIFFVLLFSTSLWANDAIKNNPYFVFIREDVIEFSTTQNKAVDLTLVIDNQSVWNQKNILEHINKTQMSLGLCDLQLKKIHLITVDLPQATLDQLRVENPYQGPPELKIAKAGVPSNTLVGFLLRKVTAPKAFAFNLSSVLRSEQTPSLPSFRPLLNTLWITDTHITHSSTPGADRTYSTLAHELVHILGDLGHIDSPIPNLMGNNDKVAKSYALNAEQCLAIESFPFIYLP